MGEKEKGAGDEKDHEEIIKDNHIIWGIVINHIRLGPGEGMEGLDRPDL